MTQLVGILNITPDSFSDGGHFVNAAAALAHSIEMFSQGAAIVDIGAESTRPGAVALTPDEEWERLEPILTKLIPRYPGQISLDTYHHETVLKAFAIGDVIVNDVTGMTNPDMIDVVLELRARCIISHLPATAKGSIQTAHTQGLLNDIEIVKQDLLRKQVELVQRGLPSANIILDPGIGFGKTPELNQQLLAFARFVPGKSVMIGYSRKRFLGDERMKLAANIEAGKVAIDSGATYLRVHDVAGHAALLP